MPLTIQQQYQTAISAVTRGDIDLLEKLMVNPQAITAKEQQSVAERLGFQRGITSAIINTVADPSVWMASWLSRKFPMNAWLNGVIPQRFIGNANEFSGVSLAVRPTDNMFRGTIIPKMGSLSQHRQAEVMKAAKPLTDLMKRPNWAEEMPIVSLAAEGAAPSGMTPELKAVTQQFRAGMNALWPFLQQSKRISGGLDVGQRARVSDYPASQAPKYLRDFIPHIPLTGNESHFEIDGRMALEKLAGGANRSNKQLLKMKKEDINQVWRPGKNGQPLESRFSDFVRLVNNVGPQVWNPHLFRRTRQGIRLGQQDKFFEDQLFHTDLNLIIQKYVSSVARTYSVNAPLTPYERSITSVVDEFGKRHFPSSEPIMAQVINEGLRVSGFQVERKQIAGTNQFAEQIIPSSGSGPMLRSLQSTVKTLRGNQAEDQILFAPIYNKVFSSMDRLLKRGEITNEQATAMADGVHTISQTKDYRRRLNGVTEYLYATTLGLNPMSSIKNLMQPVLTTANAIGIGSTIAGYRELGPKIGRLHRDVANELRSLPRNLKGLPRVVEAGNRAFQKNFPELVEQGLDFDPRMYDINEPAVKSLVSPNGKFVDKDSLFKFMLGPFMGSEFANRASAFYGAKHALRQHIRTGEYPLPKKPDGSPLSNLEINGLLDFEAGNVVNATQFRPGPGTRTVVQSLLPSPLRMFTTFPIRLFNFFADSTVRGAMTQAQLDQMRGLSGIAARATNGRNLGTLARAYLFGNIATRGLREVAGVDLGDATGLSSLVPFVPSDQPFAPLPIPPLPSAVFGIVSAFANRDIKKLHPIELPGGGSIPVPRTLFPGGIALSRISRALNQFKPDSGGFYDEEERLLFKGQTPDLILQMMGIPLDKARRERQQLERLHANRTVIRGMRREFLLASSNHNFDKMSRVRQKYKKAFPDMPELSVSKREIDRFDSSRRLTRIQRMIGTLPASFRTLEKDIYDFDPDLIEPRQGLQSGLPGL